MTEENSPDILLLDIDMPEPDGHAVASHVRGIQSSPGIRRPRNCGLSYISEHSFRDITSSPKGEKV